MIYLSAAGAFAQPGAADPPIPKDGELGAEPDGESATETAAPGEAVVEVEVGPAAPRAAAPSEEPIEVMVTGTRVGRTAGSAHVVSDKQLQRKEYDDPHAMLLAVPGVYVRGEDGFGLRPNIGLRGANPDRSKKVTLMEDGILFAPAPYSAPAAYYFPLITRMAAARVIKGPSTISYGPQTIGGAIDLRTRSIPARAHGAVDVAGGEHAYGKLHTWYGTSDERSGFLIEGVHLRNGGFKELDGGGDTGFARNEWMFKGRHVLDPRARVHNELTLKLGYSDEVSDETYLGLTDADLRTNPDRRYRASRFDRMKWHRTQIVLGHLLQPSPDLELRTTVYRHDFSRSWRKLNSFQGAALADVLADPGSARNAIFYGVLTGAIDASSLDETLLIGPNQRDFVSQGVQVMARLRASHGPFEHRIEYSVRYHNDSVERRHTEDGFLMQGGELVPDGLPTRVTAHNLASAHALALHVADAVTWRRLTLTPGLRAELIRGQSEDRLTGVRGGGMQQILLPGAGAFYSLTDDFGVLAGVHKGFSPAPPGQRVEPEHSTSYEAGVRYDRRPARAELIGFVNDYDNLSDICTFSNGCLDANLDRQFDAGRARIHGLEVYAEHEIHFGQWQFPLTAAYTFTRGEFLTSFQSADSLFGDVEVGDELPYLPEHQVGATAGLGMERWLATLSGVYVSPMREIAGSGEPAPSERTDELFVLDASGQYRLTRALRVYLNARNLLDGRFIVARRPFGARPNAPRWFQVGLKVEL